MDETRGDGLKQWWHQEGPYKWRLTCHHTDAHTNKQTDVDTMHTAVGLAPALVVCAWSVLLLCCLYLFVPCCRPLALRYLHILEFVPSTWYLDACVLCEHDRNRNRNHAPNPLNDNTTKTKTKRKSSLPRTTRKTKQTII